MDELGRLGWDEGAGRLHETLCLSLKYSVLLSQLCLEQNQDRLKKICPNTFYERFDEEINAHCGACVVRDGMGWDGCYCVPCMPSICLAPLKLSSAHVTSLSSHAIAGFDIAECCAKTKGGCKGDAGRANLEACIKDLASPSSKDRYIGCDAAILEQLNFRCGVAVESVCGKYERDAFAFIECIEREVPCPDGKSMLS